MHNNLKETSATFFGGLIGIIFWVCTGGMMLLHSVSFFMGSTSLLLGLIGIFVPPIGVVNGFIFITTGDGIQQFF